MRILVIGATGMVGTRIVAEAAARGHHVTAAARTPGRHRHTHGAHVPGADVLGTHVHAALDPGTHVHQPTGTVEPLALDAAATDQVADALGGADAAVLTVRAPAGRPGAIVPVTEAVLDAAGRRGARLLVVGGAGPLRSPRGADRVVVDDPAYVPAQWREIAGASVTQLDICERHANRDWVYLSPPAVLEPGERTGSYRRGTTTLLTDADGVSRISAEDLAAAVVDELEHPGHDRHVTVAET
ncbi:NAD(P)-dependent oxidoreductase [Georgenia sp. Z1344]|uniref:NAD(P)-dependent oxidoreductase n=1 Tax=Georgenia sp. Z1344 TaxID=3416706 RepID=UPI003CF8F901